MKSAAADELELQESDAVHRHARLNAVSACWTLLTLDEAIIERARHFTAEPVRTLDAIHLATALTARKALSEPAMLSLDDRIRKAADRQNAELGL
jgi:predicted nucleic acid-binding protein